MLLGNIKKAIELADQLESLENDSKILAEKISTLEDHLGSVTASVFGYGFYMPRQEAVEILGQEQKKIRERVQEIRFKIGLL